MKISEQWLRDWVNPDNNSEQLADQLTMAGLEIDDRYALAAPCTGVVVGQVTSVEPHPDADKLRVTQVDIGTGELLQIVCGAPNVTQGMKAPVATIGANLPTPDGKSFKIKKSKLRGVESQGMLCGASEIDLPDSIDGLLELAADAPIGMDIREYLGLDNQVLDIAITPNRGDCLSVRGISRELAVINNMPVNAPVINAGTTAPTPTTDKKQAVEVNATEACPRYLAQPISGIDRSQPTPKWMQDSLLQSGLRTHNFLVDVTNYVLLELGQPLHAFDADKIVGSIQVRLAQKDEMLTLLNEQTITLQGDELVIADDEGILALAGIMGGMRSSVTADTKNIVLESAFFNPLNIAGRARRFGLHTDASQRFERGVDFELPALALARAASLIVDIADGKAGNITTVEEPKHLPSRHPILLPIAKVKEVLGVDIATDDMMRILTQLGFEVTHNQAQNLLTCTPPSYRFDMAISEDLIEEIARIYGYDNIPMQLPHLQVNMDYQDSADLTLRLKLALVEAGYMEAVSFSFTDPKMEQLLHDKALGEVLPLANPISSDLAVMRRTLLSSLLPCVQYNLNRQQTRIRFFETGLSFVGQNVQDLLQTPSIALVAVGDAEQEQAYQNRAYDFYDLKHDVEQLLPSYLLTGKQTRMGYKRSDLAFLHPGQSATLYVDDKPIGWFGQLHPSIAQQLDLPTTWVAQLDLQPLLALSREQSKITTPSKYPQVRRDIAIIVDANIPLQDIMATITQSATQKSGNMLSDVWLFDVYQGDNMPAGKRSLAFALIWQDATQTLADETVKQMTDHVITELATVHHAKLRDS